MEYPIRYKCHIFYIFLCKRKLLIVHTLGMKRMKGICLGLEDPAEQVYRGEESLDTCLKLKKL